MAEVLSQSQIDALLSAARSGEMKLGQGEQPTEKKYRKYDFYSPRKFTKDRLKMICGVFENYTRIVNSRINGLLHTTCEIAVESVEEQRYYEFSNALSDGDVLALADVEMNGRVQSEDSPVLLHFNTALMLNMMDRLMGGEGEDSDRVPSGYTFTTVELKLYENIVYLEMRSRGYEVQVGKLDDTEIDFICYRGDEKLYIQVAYLITPADEEREFGNLERLHDNYPKYVISGDLVNLSRNGIIHRNIIDFLLNP